MRTDERRWVLLRTFHNTYRSFHALFDAYERRVKSFAELYGVDRKELELTPDELMSLFDPNALLALRDGDLALLREISHQLFRGLDAPDPFDNYVSHIYHEVSILKEEHWTVREESMYADPSEYKRYYREVNVYYPKRLKHVRNLYGKARTRLEQLLPGMSTNRIIVRSLYLFGARLVHGVYRNGLEEVYGHMYPRGGALRGFAVAGDSFLEGGFGAEAAEAYGRALEVADRRLAALAGPSPAPPGGEGDVGDEPQDALADLERQRLDVLARRERAQALL
jgi:hypothetical protein